MLISPRVNSELPIKMELHQPYSLKIIALVQVNIKARLSVAVSTKFRYGSPILEGALRQQLLPSLFSVEKAEISIIQYVQVFTRC